MFFPVDADEWSKALGQIRRLRHRGNWERIGSSDAYWTKAFFAALVETVDSLLLEKPDQAFKLSSQGILLAERIRAEDCPGNSELGKRSLKAWAHAVHGSSCRCLERFEEAKAAFEQALWLAGKGVFPWAEAEASRRFAALLWMQGSQACFSYLDRAFRLYGEHSIGLADTLVLRGFCHQYVRNDLPAASREMSNALQLLEPGRSPREARTWASAIHNLSVIYAKGHSDLGILDATLKQIRKAAAALSGREVFRRNLCYGVEALLLAPLGSARMAERLLKRVCRWFFKHGHFHRGALSSIDLAIIHLRGGDKEAALEVVEQLKAELAKAPPEVRRYVEGWLENWFRGEAAELQAEDLTPIREAFCLAAFQQKETAQPLGMIDSPPSGSSPETVVGVVSPAAAAEGPVSD